MGGGPSRLVLKDGEAYDKNAKERENFFDIILNLLAKNTSYQDLLNLHNLGACSAYVFAAADAVSTVFQKLQVDPKLGAKGEIYFAPLKDLIPGYGSKQLDTETAERIKERNRMCLNVGYNYIRVFQILTSLGLTTLNSSPLRRKFGFKQPITTSIARGPRVPVLYGGGRGITQGTPIFREIMGSLLAPLMPWLSRSEKLAANQLFLQGAEKKSRPMVYIAWAKEGVLDSDTLALDASYVTADRAYEFKFIAKKVDDGIYYYINNESDPLVRMKKRVADNKWVYDYENPGFSDSDPEPFMNELHKQLKEDLNLPAAEVGPVVAGLGAPTGVGASQPVARTYTISSDSYSAPVGSATSGKSVFDGFDAIKQLYDGRLVGKEFPKAYCVGRAMTLLNPIFDNELLKGQDYTTQICSARLDFETAGDYLPRPGKTPKANIYFRSLVALYYDDFELRGNEVVFTKTETGNSELRQACEQFAKMFQAPKEQQTFLESQQQFRPSILCNRAQGGPIPIAKDTLVRELKQKIIRPMLDLQQQHNKRVNEFLKKLFVFSVDKKGAIAEMKFSKIIKTGGRDAINELSREARNMLLDYYKKTEAYYTQGVLLIEQNTGSLKG